jgi:hypothetical protein
LHSSLLLRYTNPCLKETIFLPSLYEEINYSFIPISPIDRKNYQDWIIYLVCLLYSISILSDTRCLHQLAGTECIWNKHKDLWWYLIGSDLAVQSLNINIFSCFFVVFFFFFCVCVYMYLCMSPIISIIVLNCFPLVGP